MAKTTTPSFLRAHYTWRKAQTETVAEMDRLAIQYLLRMVPEELRPFLENQCRLETILKEGTP